MNDDELCAKLTELLAMPCETEWVEFKKDNTDPRGIGQYISALSNAAARNRQKYGYMVWGIEDGTQKVIGTGFNPQKTKGEGNEDLRHWLMRGLSPMVDIKFCSFEYQSKPIVMLIVPAAYSTPVAYSKIRWIRIDSYTKPLHAYAEIEAELWRTLRESPEDWSAQLCPTASLDAIDPKALEFARQQFKVKHASKPELVAEADNWDDLTFLHKVKLALDGKLKRAAIILLGRPESVVHISDAVAHVTWILKDSDGIELDHAHFYPPFILNVDEVFKKVRNLTLRTMPSGTLFPTEITKYDNWVFREALHNCIAHQDYTQKGRINLIEQDDSLLFTNLGSFIPGTVENVIERDAPEETYRNGCLASAMVSLNMIETVGSGIKRMFRKQKERFLPMPDYDLTDPIRVKVRIIGKILDERFTLLLMNRTELKLADVIWLDKVQKGRPIPRDAHRSLKLQGLIEGRKAAPFISAAVAVVTGQEAEYIRNRGIEKHDCKRKVVDYLKQFGSAARKKFVELLAPHLSAKLNERQKRDFVRNLLQEMRREKIIRLVQGNTKGAAWELAKPSGEPEV